jgi:regulator of protease activity HflC (stomatin/prohibitin superfamily)
MKFFRIISTAETGVLQTFGRFSKTMDPGFHFIIPFVQKITPVSNRVVPLNFNFVVKTKDSVFTKIALSVQYKIEKNNTEQAYFSLVDPVGQINSYVENTVRSNVPKIKLDELFESSDHIRNSVSSELSVRMKQYGYTIVDVLVTDISPSTEVKDAMNKINASERLKDAAKNEAEANYILKVREAEADRERKRLQGEGMSQQRHAILDGYKRNIDDMSSKFGLTARDIIEFVTKTQYLDMLENVGKSNNAKTVFINHDPASINTKHDVFRNAIMEANQVSKK